MRSLRVLHSNRKKFLPNETNTFRPPLLSLPALCLAEIVRCETLVASFAAGAGTGVELSQRSSEGRHTCAHNRHHYAPITHWLCRRNYFWGSARAADGAWTLLHDTIGTLALGLQTLPSVCWVPLALLWFGQTEAAMLFVVIMGTLWSVVIATDTGVRNVPPIYRRAALTMGSKRLHMWFTVILPAALPFIVSGMKQGWAFAWRSLMAAEIFVTILTGFGLGQLLHYGRELNAMEQVIGIMFVIVVIGLLADKILFFAGGAISPSPVGHQPITNAIFPFAQRIGLGPAGNHDRERARTARASRC